MASIASATRTASRGAPSLHVEALRRRQRGLLVRAAMAVVAVTALAALLLGLVPGSLSIGLGLGAMVVLPALLAWLWRSPVRGVYVLFAAALLLEEYFFGNFADDIGAYLPFFQDISTWTHVSGLAVSLAELFMLLALVIWLLKDIAARRLRFERGSLWRPLSLYMLMVLVGEIYGLATGGDFRTSLWEVRSQVYMFVAYVLACNLIRTRKQVDVLVWLLLLGAGLKGIQGTWRWLITLHGHLDTVQQIFPHEQSLFFNALLTYTPILFLYGGSRRLKRAALWLLPFVIMATIANQRRAAIIALLVSLLGLVLVTAVAHPPRRRAAVQILLALILLCPPYVLVFGHQSGAFAGPARAIMSAFRPDPRDAASNLYRRNEDKDILFTMQKSPIIGYGFGKAMETPYPLADLSQLYVWWKVLPHDSILWVWMRMGTIGYVLLWVLIGTAIVQAARLLRRLDDPRLKGVTLLIILLIMQEVVIGYLDLAWTNYRTLIVVGVLFALIGRLQAYARPEERAAVRVRARNARAVPPSAGLAVVDGRLV